MDKTYYPYILLVGCLAAFECLWIGFMAARHRRDFFSEEMLNKNFQETHEKQIGKGSLRPGGYPDTGNGRYSEKLEYKQWVQFNLDQRAHKNFLEMLP